MTTCVHDSSVNANLSDRKKLITLLDVVLPTRSGVTIRKRCISRATEHQAILLHHLNLHLPNWLEMALM
jgi:hypothetical protein